MHDLKLFMVLLGAKPPGRHIEQHDIFFGVAASLDDLSAEIRAFWPEPDKIHVDGWREVNVVDNYRVTIQPRQSGEEIVRDQKLFFINLGGYQREKFEEQHYMLLTVKKDRTMATNEAKQTFFFQNQHFKGAPSHIDDKYGIDVDDLYEIEEILSPGQKELYQIVLSKSDQTIKDEIHLGYHKLKM